MYCLAATFGDISGKFNFAIIKNDSTAETNENTHTPQLKQKSDVESQTSSIKETSLQNPEPLRKSSQKMKLLENQYSASMTPRTLETKPKKRLTISQLKCNGDDKICLLTHNTNFTTVWQTLVRDETWTSSIYLCPSSETLKSASASGFRKLSNYLIHLTSSILGTKREVCPQSLH